MALNDFVISFLDVEVSIIGMGSTLARGDLAAPFSGDAIDSGRLLLGEPRGDGRCCQDRVFDRDGAIVALGEGFD